MIPLAFPVYNGQKKKGLNFLQRFNLIENGSFIIITVAFVAKQAVKTDGHLI
jgi:hypothetical protein